MKPECSPKDPLTATRIPKRGFTLVEVMIATCIFSMLALSSTALFLQNHRTAAALRYRTHATTIALNVLEQLRLKQYGELKTLHDTATTTSTIMVLIADPNYTPATPDPYASLNLPTGLRPVELNLNVLDAAEIKSTWTPVNVPLESTAGAPVLQTRYWLTLSLNRSTTTPIVEAVEIVLVYQWKPPAALPATEWQSGTVRLVVPNPQPIKAEPAV